MARSVGVVNGSCYVSILNVTVGEEMNNRTIECVHRDLDGQINIIMVHQKTLNISHSMSMANEVDSKLLCIHACSFSL